MRYVHLFFALLFLLFAAVQVNDPDPLGWILIYGLMAVLSVLAAFRIYPRRVLWVVLAGYSVYAVVLAPGAWRWWTSEDRSLLFDDLAKMQTVYIEEAREFLGLIICLAVLVFYLVAERGGR